MGDFGFRERAEICLGGGVAVGVRTGVLACAPCLASPSASSLPSTPACPGTQPMERSEVSWSVDMSPCMLVTRGRWALAFHLPVLTFRAYWLSMNR